MSDLDAPAPVPVTRRLLLLLGLLGAASPFATDGYPSALPALALELDASMAQLMLGLPSYLLGLLLGQLVYGPVADAWGRRAPLLAGLWLFAVGSLLLVVSQRAELLIGVRMLQAIGGCAGMIVTRAVLQDLLGERQSATVLTVVMTLQVLGLLLMPWWGSWLVHWGGWRGALIVLAALGLCCFLAAWRGLPDTLPVAGRRALSLRCVLKTLWRLLKRRAFVLPTLVGAAAMALLFAYVAGAQRMPIPFQSAWPPTLEARAALTACLVLAAGMTGAWTLRRWTPRCVMHIALAAMTLAAIGAMLAGRALPGLSSGLLSLCVCGAPVVIATSTALAMQAGRDAAGTASSLLGTLQFAAAIAGAVLTRGLAGQDAAALSAALLICVMLATLLAWWPLAWAQQRDRFGTRD